MTVDKSSETDTNQEADVSRFGLFGDFPTRVMFTALRLTPKMPYFLEAGLLYLCAFVIFLLARQQRSAIRGNLRVIHPDLSLAEGYVGAFRVFVNFGWTCIDGMRTRLGQKVVSWEIDNLAVFEQLRETQGAALILTTHTGNYDLAAALFSPKFGRDLHTVRAPEKSPYLQEIRRRDLAKDTSRYEHFKVHYNASESMLGIELARLLMEGELVAIQSDRVIAQVSGLEVPLKGRKEKFRIPRGPMTLATISKCPCFPLHVVRAAHRHYRIVFQAPLEVLPGKVGARVREMDYAEAWAACLMPFLEKHSSEWFVFENAFTE
ncbi:hypothetical protein ACFSSA_05865 [Luteolibacter algae]|uniref:Lipid A biosynthesis acyltransferase n=1 Tax=Luteolibacter algae TaxID=454151 RepID=A0ABW5D578_9BACT